MRKLTEKQLIKQFKISNGFEPSEVQVEMMKAVQSGENFVYGPRRHGTSEVRKAILDAYTARFGKAVININKKFLGSDPEFRVTALKETDADIQAAKNIQSIAEYIYAPNKITVSTAEPAKNWFYKLLIKEKASIKTVLKWHKILKKHDVCYTCGSKEVWCYGGSLQKMKPYCVKCFCDL